MKDEHAATETGRSTQPTKLAAEASRRWAIYWLLIAIVTGQMVARIAQVKSRDGETPFLSANDRSRWATVRSLVDEGTFALDDVIVNPETGKWDKRWHSIDLVRHRGSDGQEHYYSSKPTLFSVLLAGEYWLIKQVTRVEIGERPFYIGRTMLVLTNVLPLVGMLLLLARWLEADGSSDWGRIFVFAVAAFATPLTTFSVTLNNHSPAAIAALVAVLATVAVLPGGKGAAARAPSAKRYFLLAGFAAAFAASCELPALSLFALLAMVLASVSLRHTLLCYLPAAALVGIAAVGTNYLAHQSLKPPYAHRKDGPVLAKLPKDVTQDALQAGQVEPSLEKLLRQFASDPTPLALSVRGDESGQRWVLWDSVNQRRWVVRGDADHSDSLDLHAWDNWYEFDGSYWSSGKLQGVDRGEPSRLVYAWHATLGHHGVFSLTPVWLFAVWGLALWLRSGDRTQRGLAAGIVLLTLVCFAFYLSRGLIDRNYGGVSCTFRWLLWFTPLWLLALTPAAEQLSQSRWGRIALLAALGLSVFSAAYNATNPWTHPWLFDYWSNLGWIDYS